MSRGRRSRVASAVLATAALSLSMVAAAEPLALRDALSYRVGHGLDYQAPGLPIKLNLSALVQFDVAFFDADRRALHDDAEVRRARIALRGKLGRHWRFGSEADFSGPDPRLTEASLSRAQVAGGRLTLGYIKEPIGLEWQDSSRSVTFMERALPNELLPAYHLGSRLNWHGRNWSLAAGGFGGGVYHDSPTGGDWGVTARATFAPVHSRRRVVHFGVGGAHRELAGEHGSLRLAPRPEAHLSTVDFIDTRTVSRVDDQQLLSAELALVEGPWSAQAEYLHHFVHRAGGRADLDFAGWYGQLSWLLTGESRRYKARLGRFVGITPRRPLGRQGGLGAWELALRYSTLDLNDGPIAGGEQQNLSFGLNWYPQRYARFMANVVLVDTDANSLGRRGRGEERPAIVQLRAQFAF